ncbi:NAD(P)-binding protein [Patellaria atrata CBS 101060]|uniref:NAD(P)-binding protein n=1 Tax=Patellaria atrata CBS 101060 TaxID=1346257 RepID=A0A9P4VK55_9PEZI|nr:NAD(P)-binding protein [Patellaria atrata CBS 101060]
MSPRNLKFRCALVTGGAGGIGRAISEYFISQGKKVIIAGRTESKLKETAQAIGAAGYYLIDTGDIANIPSFIRNVISENPDVDCLVNNAGVQKPLSYLEDKPEDILQKADQEIDINVRGPLHLSVSILEHFKSQPNGGVIMNVSSALGIIPFNVVNPVYNATKAWIHFFTMNLRTQLQESNVRVVEIVPPLVESDLHRERSDPDDNKKAMNPVALSMEEFMNCIIKGLEEDKTIVSAGMGQKVVDRWYREFGTDYAKAVGDE